MRAVIQRVHRASVTIDHNETTTRHIDKGLVVFLGVTEGDTEKQVEFMSHKVCELRIFSDTEDKMNLSLSDIGGDILIISNFTLGTDCKKGRRPSFDLAAKPTEAERLYLRFVETVKKLNLAIGNVQCGEFGAHMDVSVQNDGPVTIIIDTEKIGK